MAEELHSTPDETLAAEATARRSAVLQRGDLVGRYVVLGRIGAGGMGVVYGAYDPELDRKVALKLLHAHADGTESSDGHRRLLREAQAMAKLSHPNVMAIHDVGEHGGRVFLAMEFVEGETLGAWLKRERTWREILEVFTRAGRGLVAAHRKGLVHRDFKPENVMVDRDGRVRVMDFGLARPSGASDGQPVVRDAAVQPTTDALTGELTREGKLVGTPAYMAPEQHAGATTDARTDQFSFCVGLYEALYGERPFPGTRLASLAMNVLSGTIREPRAGSTVPGWLRAIVVRGLATQPHRRFPSMEALLVALASDPTPSRRRVAVAAAVVVVAGAAFAGWRLQRAHTLTACATAGQAIATDWSEPIKGEVREAMLATADASAPVTFDKTVPWLDRFADDWRSIREQVCIASEVDETLDHDTRVRALDCLEERRAQLIELTALLRDATTLNLNRAVLAAASLPALARCHDSVWLQRQPAVPADRRTQVAELGRRFGRIAALIDTARYEEALGEAQAVKDEAARLGLEPLEARARVRLGDALERRGEFEAARTELVEAVYQAGGLGINDLAAEAAEQLGFLMGERLAQHDEGLAWLRFAEMWRTALQTDEDDLSWVMIFNHRGLIQHARGAHDDAKRNLERALAIRTRVLGPDHPSMAPNLNNLGALLYALGDYDEALAAFERATTISENTLGPEHPHVGSTLSSLGTVEYVRGNVDDAIRYLERALVIKRKTVGADHPSIAPILNNLGMIDVSRGDLDVAQGRFEQAMAIDERMFGPDHPNVASTLENLGIVEIERGRAAPAMAHLERALAIRLAALGPEHRSLANTWVQIGRAHLLAGRPEAAAPLLEQALARRQANESQAADLAAARFELARALWLTGGDRTRSMLLALQARDGYTDAGASFGRELDKVEAWLEQRRNAG